jgi:hypothetical protein
LAFLYVGYNIHSSLSETVRNETHVHIYFLFRMTDAMTSQNIDLTSWDTLYIVTSNDYRQVLDWWLDLLHTLIPSVTTFYSFLLHIVFTVTSSLPLLGNGFQPRSFPSSGFPNCLRPQLPASDRNSSWLNPSSSLTATQSQSYFTTGGLPPSVRLGDKPFEAHDQRFFFATELLQPKYVCNIFSDERMSFSLMNMLGLCQVYLSHIYVT